MTQTNAQYIQTI